MMNKTTSESSSAASSVGMVGVKTRTSNNVTTKPRVGLVTVPRSEHRIYERSSPLLSDVIMEGSINSGASINRSKHSSTVLASKTGNRDDVSPKKSTMSILKLSPKRMNLFKKKQKNKELQSRFSRFLNGGSSRGDTLNESSTSFGSIDLAHKTKGRNQDMEQEQNVRAQPHANANETKVGNVLKKPDDAKDIVVPDVSAGTTSTEKASKGVAAPEGEHGDTKEEQDWSREVQPQQELSLRELLTSPMQPDFLLLTPDLCHVNSVELDDNLGRRGLYTGNVDAKTNKPHGEGRMEYISTTTCNTDSNSISADNSEEVPAVAIFTYDGQWVNGDWSGFAKFIDNRNGDTYEGGFFDNRKHGQGILRYRDGTIYDGWFQLDKMGKGRMTYLDGSTFWGCYSMIPLSANNDLQAAADCTTTIIKAAAITNVLPNGRGKYCFTDGTTYDGEFENGIICGHGRMNYTDGRWYLGEWCDGQKNGLGIEVLGDGTLFHEGIFCNDKPVTGSSFVSKNISFQLPPGSPMCSEEFGTDDGTAQTATTSDSIDAGSGHGSRGGGNPILLYRTSKKSGNTLIGPLPRRVHMRKLNNFF